MTVVTERECPILGAAGHLARKRGLTGEKEQLTCSYTDCDKVNCLKSEEPDFRTLYLSQSGVSDSESNKEKFFSRLKKTLQIIRQ